MRGGRLDLLGADPCARTKLDRELLDLAHEPLLTIADLSDERLRGIAVELDAELGRLALQPFRQLPGLQRALDGDVPARALDGLAERRADLEAPLLAPEEGDRRVGRNRLERGRDVGLDVRVLPALDAVDDDEAPADRERHGGKRAGDCLGRRGVALVAFQAAATRLALGERSQPGAALADAPVVVAVDEVGGLELGHGGRV